LLTPRDLNSFPTRRSSDLHSFPYLTPSIKAPAADLIIVAVKEYQLAAALLLIEPFVGPDTFFLSLLNGISSEVAIGKAYGAERVDRKSTRLNSSHVKISYA